MNLEIIVAPESVQSDNGPMRFVALDSGKILVGRTTTHACLIEGCGQTGHAILASGSCEKRIVFDDETPFLKRYDVLLRVAEQAIRMAIAQAERERQLAKSLKEMADRPIQWPNFATQAVQTAIDSANVVAEVLGVMKK